jgi:hypothetical protein
MSENPSIQIALAAVMRDVDHVAKSDRNTHQNFSFRGIDAVLNAVGPALRKHSVIVLPNVTNVAHQIIETANGKSAYHVLATVEYRFIGPAGDSLTATVVGEAMDYGDKAVPKAMSVAFRTALLQSLALPTDEPDPDSETFERGAASGERNDFPALLAAIKAAETLEQIDTVATRIQRAGSSVNDAQRNALRTEFMKRREELA